ncbi:tetratricopeptide repeat protein 5-like isoform X4 [Camellia sinensis]|uniref:tetratricopeptide repeat protein 5-like isoform X4 n=1 Tax=Camellia sinensis TaxID=4442 RepID=UPI001036567A|nr:tetratricopeptide repeat protein 5-like isoform X4 [Camellia sinensis]
MSNQSQGEDSADTMAKAMKASDDLYNIRDSYFPSNPDDKISRLQSDSDLALKLLDSIPSEQRKLPMQRATYEYLRGKILDVFPDYRKEAEDHLSKAVKLNPSLADAWLCLAVMCAFIPSVYIQLPILLYLMQGPNKKILCQLSMLERRMAQGADNQAEIVEESIKHAKEAIMLDVKDGNSWYNLGNAWLTFFFVTGAWDHSKLLQSLKAYQNAEKDESMNSNPDLSFNCATVNKYLENYERALTNFESAASRDPGLNAAEEAHKIVNLLDKLESLLRGQTKTKRLVSLASSLAAVNLNPSYRRATIDSLSEGLNKQVAIIGKVLFFVKHENVAPLYYLVCDSNHFCYVLSVYGIRDDAIKEGDQLTLVEPNYRNVDFSWKGKFYQFRSVRVDFLEQVLVNGKALSFQQAVRSSIHAQHKP